MPSKNKSSPSRQTPIHRLTPRRKFDTERKPSSRQTQQQDVDARRTSSQNLSMTASPTEEDGLPKDNASSSDGGFSSGEDSSSDSESDDDPASQHARASTIDRAALAASLPPNTNIDGLSDYELLRLKNIQRNQAKLASLGLSGITTKESPKIKKVPSETAKKAANTRRRNAQRAKTMIEQHERWKNSNGDAVALSNSNSGAKLPGSTRSQPSRAAKSQEISYTRLSYSTPPKRIQQWASRLSELKSFYSTYGNYNISCTAEDGRYKSLHGWMKRQRAQYLKYKRGERSALDEERVGLLEALDGGWCSTVLANAEGGGQRISEYATMKRGLRSGSSPGSTNIARQLWKSSESETDEDESIQERLKREVDEETTEEEEVEIGSLDSYSGESLDDDHQYKREREEDGGNDVHRHKGGEIERGRTTEDIYSDDSQVANIRKERNRRRRYDRHASFATQKRGATANNRRQGVSSLEQVAPHTANHHVHSPQKRKRDGGNERTRRKRTYSSNSDVDSIFSTETEEISTIEQEKHFRRGDNHKRRRRHHRQEHKYYHSRRRMSAGGTRPVNEIIISQSPAQSTLADFKNNGQRNIEVQSRKNIEIEQHFQRQQCDRDELLVEYGRLYGRLCLINEQKAQLEYELRELQPCITGSHSVHHGNACPMLPPDVTTAAMSATSKPLCSSGGVSSHR